MADLFLIQNTEILDLFEIKINDYEGYLRFHGSKNLDKDIVFNDRTYLYIPSEISNLEYNSDGKQNRPTLTISNINNYITNFIKDRNDLLGCKFYKRKILAKDLDPVNFGGESKNPLGQGISNSFISTDLYIIQKKNFETKEKVEFALANVLDLEGVSVPSRKIYNDSCQWQYRGCGCNYGKVNGYDGPNVIIETNPYTSLTQINSDYSLTDNLIVWLKPDGISTSGQTSFLQYGSNKKFTFDLVSSWTNQGTSTSTAIVNPSFLSTKPKLYKNEGRLNNQNGVYFASHVSLIDQMKITQSYSGVNLTIFYVSEMVNKAYAANSGAGQVCVNGAVSRRGLCSSNFVLGFYDFRTDTLYSNGNFLPLGPQNACEAVLNKPIAYGAVLPTSSGSQTKFIVNGETKLMGTTYSHSISNLGINEAFYDQNSDIVVYEVIVFKSLLTDIQIKAVSSYLSNKYNLPISFSNTYFNTVEKTSRDYFNAEDGNLGIPMADENNKLFLSTASTNTKLSNYESYNIKSLVWKGDYKSDVQYKQGDFVKIDPDINFDFNEKYMIKNYELPSRFFVCVSNNGSKNIHPLSNTNIWVEDKCSKNLNGCLLRFNTSIINIPFGGFPGTVGYDYKLPS